MGEHFETVLATIGDEPTEPQHCPECAEKHEALAALDRIQAENARLLSEVKDLRYELSKRPWTWGDDLQAEYRTMEAENERLREAVKAASYFLASGGHVRPGLRKIQEQLRRAHAQPEEVQDE